MSLLAYLRVTFRQLLRTPGPSTLAVLALGLGVGLVSTQFALTEGILLRDLPFAGAGRLFHVARTSDEGGTPWMTVPVRDFEEFRRQQTSFATFCAFSSGSLNYSGGPTPPRRFNGASVTHDLFPALGVRPVLGRDFREGEAAPGAPALAILSHATWQREFGGASDVIGRSFRLNGTPTTVIGIMPEGFSFPMNHEDVWTNLRTDRTEVPGKMSPRVEMLGHLKPGVTLERARTELNGISGRLAERWPETNRELRSMEIDRFPFAYSGVGTQPLLVVMLAMTLFVLLLACANVANLLLARAVRRTRELAIRVALGAGRWQIVRQILGESLLLSGLGAVLGLALAAWGVTLLNREISQKMDVPFWFDFQLNPTVLLLALVATVTAGVVAGLLPALHSAQTDFNEVLKDDTRGGSSRWLARFGKLLVGGQVALSCALLVGSTMLAIEVISLKRMHLADHPEQLIAGRLELHDAEYGDAAARSRFYRDVVDRVSALPGVDGAAVSSRDLVNSGVQIRVEFEGANYPRETDRPSTILEVVSPEYFRVVGLRTVRGRLFNAGDTSGHPPVAVVNQSFAQRHWPGQDPLGKRIRRYENDAPWATVVGVVPDLSLRGMSGFAGGPADDSGYYLCQNQMGWGWLHLFVRVQGDPQAMIDPVRRTVAEIDPDQPIHAVNTLIAITNRSLQGLQVVGSMVGIFGVVAAFLAAVGVFGVTSFSVTQRTREFGIRAALGADMFKLTLMVLRQGVGQLAVGLSLGLGLAFLLVRPLGGFLSQISTSDPAVYSGVALLMGGVAILAIWLPARRAARIDPLEALRSE